MKCVKSHFLSFFAAAAAVPPSLRFYLSLFCNSRISKWMSRGIFTIHIFPVCPYNIGISLDIDKQSVLKMTQKLIELQMSFTMHSENILQWMSARTVLMWLALYASFYLDNFFTWIFLYRLLCIFKEGHFWLSFFFGIFNGREHELKSKLSKR